MDKTMKTFLYTNFICIYWVLITPNYIIFAPVGDNLPMFANPWPIKRRPHISSHVQMETSEYPEQRSNEHRHTTKQATRTLFSLPDTMTSVSVRMETNLLIDKIVFSFIKNSTFITKYWMGSLKSNLSLFYVLRKRHDLVKHSWIKRHDILNHSWIKRHNLVNHNRLKRPCGLGGSEFSQRLTLCVS